MKGIVCLSKQNNTSVPGFRQMQIREERDGNRF